MYKYFLLKDQNFLVRYKLNQRNPEKGRATGGSNNSKGAIFSYESLEEYQTFRGIISIEADTNEEINDKFEKINNYLKNGFYLGKSKRASYGGKVSLEWKEPRDREFDGFGNSFFQLLSFNEDLEEGKEINILLTSPYVGRDKCTGVISPKCIFEDIRQAFDNKVSLDNSKICGSIQTIGSYNKTWKSEMPQLTVLNAGTVFNIKITSRIEAETLKSIEAKGIGIRKNEGLGSFVMMKSFNNEFRIPKEIVTYKQPEIDCPDIARKIENDIVLRELKKAISKKVSKDIEVSERIPPNHLLNRFRYIIRNNYNDNKKALRQVYEMLSDSEKGFKQPALLYLKKCHIGKESLFEKLVKMLSDINDVELLNSYEFDELSNYFFLPPKNENENSWNLFKKNNIIEAKRYYLETLIHLMFLNNRISVSED